MGFLCSITNVKVFTVGGAQHEYSWWKGLTNMLLNMDEFNKFSNLHFCRWIGRNKAIKILALWRKFSSTRICVFKVWEKFSLEVAPRDTWKSSLGTEALQMCGLWKILRSEREFKGPHGDALKLTRSLSNVWIVKILHSEKELWSMEIDQKPFKCVVCEKSCTQKRNLKTHNHGDPGKLTKSLSNVWFLKFRKILHWEREIKGSHGDPRKFKCVFGKNPSLRKGIERLTDNHKVIHGTWS